MNRLFALWLLAACLALGEGGLVRRDAPAPSALDELQKHAAEFQKTFSEHINSLVNPKNTAELNKALKESSDSVLKQVSAFSASLQNALNDANGKAREALEASRAQLERAANELKRAHPDVEKEAGALRERIQGAVATTLAESQKLAKEVAANMESANAKLAPQIKSAYDDFAKHASELQQKLHEAANKQ